MSDSTLTGNAPVRRNITRKNVIIGLLLLLFVLIALWCHGRPGSELGLLGFTPLVALAILSLIGVDIVLAVISSIIIAMIMTSTGLPEMGTMLAKSTGSFIATVGLIIMLGAGVGEVATRTGAAVELVKFVVHRIGLSSQTRVKFGIVASSILICGSLGTMAGGNAIIVAVIIPVAAAVRLTPPTVAALMMTAGSVGLFTGPFTPSTVTILSLGGLSYPDYLLYVGLPMSAVTLLAGWVMAGRIQKMTEGKLRYDVDLADDEIIQVSGSQEGFAHIGFAFAGPNDLILAPDPGYPIFTFGPLMTGATIALYPLREENNWQLDFNDIPEDIAERAKAIVVSYPNNPTTAVADRAFYEKLVLFAREHNMIVLHDNAYSDLMLDGTDGLSFLSIPGAKEVGVEFNSLSKTYNLTGMRVSFVVGNRELIARFRAFRSQIDYGTFYPIQAGAVAALNGPQDIVMRNRKGYMARRDALCGGLRSIGWNVPDAQGTMFVWAKVPEGYASSAEFALDLLEKTGVIVVPGSAFGRHGEGYVRMALVVPPERMQEAVRRIAESGILNR